MEKYKGMVSDVLMVQIAGNSNLDKSDIMRVNLFTMDSERISKDIDKEFPVEIFIDEFAKKIVETNGYRSFSSFCKVDIEGLRNIGKKVYDIVTL